jgi:hypothetical protein
MNLTPILETKSFNEIVKKGNLNPLYPCFQLHFHLVNCRHNREFKTNNRRLTIFAATLTNLGGERLTLTGINYR